MESGSLASYVEKIMLAKDYKMWFSDELCKDYMGALPMRAQLAVCDEQVRDVLAETSAAMTIYSLLVFYLYPNDEKIRREIDSDKALKRNFSMVKKWLEANRGKEAADEMLGYVNASIERSQ